MPNPCNNGGNCKSHLKEINELHLHEGALQNLIHGADESVVDVVEPEEESLGDNSFAMNHHPDLYEEHDQATNSEAHLGQEHIQKHLPRFDSDTHSPWPSKSHFFHDDEADDHHFSHQSDYDEHHDVSVDNGDKFDAHMSTLYEQVQPHVNRPHHDISFEEANSIHGADSDGHPHEGEHPFTEHHPKLENDANGELVETHIRHPYSHYKNHHEDKENDYDDHIVLAKATSFKSHSAGIENEIASLDDKEIHHHTDRHDKDIHNIDQDTVAEITKNVVDAVMKAKNSKKSKLPRKSNIAKRGRSEIRKRTIHNLYVCECPPGFLGAHCQRKL